MKGAADMRDFSCDLIEKAKNAKTAEELLAIAKENGVEMTGEEAANYYTKLNPVTGELGDDELDYVHKWNKEMQFSQE